MLESAQDRCSGTHGGEDVRERGGFIRYRALFIEQHEFARELIAGEKRGRLGQFSAASYANFNDPACVGGGEGEIDVIRTQGAAAIFCGCGQRDGFDPDAHSGSAGTGVGRRGEGDDHIHSWSKRAHGNREVVIWVKVYRLVRHYWRSGEDASTLIVPYVGAPSPPAAL